MDTGAKHLVELKARYEDLAKARALLSGAERLGTFVQVDTYFVYPEELKTVARVQVFRDFVVSKAQRWPS